MVGEKFYLCISTLTLTELNSCIRFSKIDTFNRREEVTKTFEIFKRNKNKFFSLLNDEKKLFFLLFNNEKQFSKKELADNFHYCINVFEDFVVYNMTHNNKEKRLKLLEQFYYEKRLEKEFLSVNKKRIKIEESKKANIDSNLKLYLLHKNKFQYLLKSFDNEIFNELVIATEYLDKFYFLNKMNIFHNLSKNTLMNNIEYKHILKDEIFEIINHEAKEDNNILFKIYQYFNQLYENDFDLKRFYILKKLIFESIDLFSDDIKKNLLSSLADYSNYLYNRDCDNNLIHESFEIIKMQIEHKTMIENNTFPEGGFSQDIRIAMYLKEFDWAESFIEKHKKYIKNKDLIITAQAQILYSQAKYEELYETIDKLKNTSAKDEYNIKSLYAKALFDEKKYDQLSTYLINFSKSEHRNKENSKSILSSKNGFILFLGRMVKHINSKSNLEKLNIELEENKHVFHRNWLISKLNVLLKK